MESRSDGASRSGDTSCISSVGSLYSSATSWLGLITRSELCMTECVIPGSYTNEHSVNLSINPFAADLSPTGSVAIDEPVRSSIESGAICCPSCEAEIPAETGWESCPYCQKALCIQIWPVARRQSNPAAALLDQAKCFFHP